MDNLLVIFSAWAESFSGSSPACLFHSWHQCSAVASLTPDDGCGGCSFFAGIQPGLGGQGGCCLQITVLELYAGHFSSCPYPSHSRGQRHHIFSSLPRQKHPPLAVLTPEDSRLGLKGGVSRHGVSCLRRQSSERGRSCSTLFCSSSCTNQLDTRCYTKSRNVRRLLHGGRAGQQSGTFFDPVKYLRLLGLQCNIRQRVAHQAKATRSRVAIRVGAPPNPRTRSRLSEWPGDNPVGSLGSDAQLIVEAVGKDAEDAFQVNAPMSCPR
jgi:hypothetical protein